MSTALQLALKVCHGEVVSASVPRWRDSDYGRALHTVARDGYVSANMYREYREQHPDVPLPTFTAFEIHYGSWKKAVVHHGLRHGYTRRPYVRRPLPELAAAVAQVIDALGGDLPSCNQYEQWRREHPDAGAPCCALVRRRFKNWPAALTAALEHRDAHA